MAAKKTNRLTVEEELSALSEPLRNPSAKESVDALRAALLRGRSLTVARVAGAVAVHALRELEGDVARAFTRLLRDPVKEDPGCRGKVALLEALDRLEHGDATVFLTGARVVQKEAAWGPPIDTAVGVRARGIAALARLRFADTLLVAGELLSDPEAPVRSAAAEALAHLGDRQGAGLVLLKLRSVDEPAVMQACAATLMTLAPDWGISTLRPMLFGSDAELREIAAFALGEARHEAAIDLLLECVERTVIPTDRAVLLRALGQSRDERAYAFLLERIEEGSEPEAKAGIAALAGRRFEPGLADAVRSAARSNQRANLERTLVETFGDVVSRPGAGPA